MTRIDQSGGTSYTGNVYDRPYSETWEPTAHLCFIVTQPDEKRILHQLWQSNIGRSAWRPVVETYASDIETA